MVSGGHHGLLQQTLVHQRRDALKYVQLQIRAGICDRFGGLQGEAADEDCEPPEQLLLLAGQQLVAPVHGPAQRLLAFG